MRKEYRYRAFDLRAAFPIMEIEDPPYFVEDLYEIFGSKDFVATFVFTPDSDSRIRYGEMVTGTIFYLRGQRERIQACIRQGSSYDDKKVRLIATPPDVSTKDAEELKYGGFSINDIQSIIVVPYRRDEKTEGGNKRIPVVEISIPTEQLMLIDEDVIYQNVLVRKMEAGTHLIPEEKARLVGITLALNENRIATELLNTLGFTADSVQVNRSIWYHYYNVKKRRKTISDAEKNELERIESRDFAEKVVLLGTELAAGHAPGEETSLSDRQFATILESLKRFRPKVLVHMKRPIWWDARSYLHIVMRHVKDFQVGCNNVAKTPFPYDFGQLQLLIEKVVGTVAREIKSHFSGPNEPKRFHRNGRMATYYNGDYYALDIAPDGLLRSIYIVEDVDRES